MVQTRPVDEYINIHIYIYYSILHVSEAKIDYEGYDWNKCYNWNNTEYLIYQ